MPENIVIQLLLFRRYTHCYIRKVIIIMGRNFWDTHNHFNTHEAEYNDTIFNHCSDLLLYQYVYVCMCVRVCVYLIFSCHYLNNGNPSIFSAVNKLRYMLCSCVHVCLCVYSAKCWLGEAWVKSLYLSYIFYGTTLANWLLNQCSTTL